MTCIFCAIRDKKIPASIVFENDDILAFKDITPQAPIHILIIPKIHISSILEINQNDVTLLGNIIRTIQEIALTLNLGNGFRIVTNTGEEGGQTVGHLHFHLLAGRQLHWPPG